MVAEWKIWRSRVLSLGLIVPTCRPDTIRLLERLSEVQQVSNRTMPISVHRNSKSLVQLCSIDEMNGLIGDESVETFQSWREDRGCSFLSLSLAAVDVDRIAREMDFQALQDNLEQITFCNIEGEVVSCSDRYLFTKLLHRTSRIHERWIRTMWKSTNWLNWPSNIFWWVDLLDSIVFHADPPFVLRSVKNKSPHN